MFNLEQQKPIILRQKKRPGIADLFSHFSTSTGQHLVEFSLLNLTKHCSMLLVWE